MVGRQGEGCTPVEHTTNRPWLIRDELRAKQKSEARRRAEGTEILAPNNGTTRWGVQVVELEQRIEVTKECREAQAELSQAVAQTGGMGAHLRAGLIVKQGGWN